MLQDSDTLRAPAWRHGESTPRPAIRRALLNSWRWAALPFGVLYLVLLALQFRDVLGATFADADTVSAPVIGQLFGDASPHATTVLGEFGWYATLLFELATKWLPLHRPIWEAAPYAMALAGAALTAWSVGQLAGRWAAGLTAVLLICAAPPTLHLLISTTQHAPAWFCCALLGAFLVLLQRRGATIRPAILVVLALVVGSFVGVNAASDLLVVVGGLVPFVLALAAGYVVARGRASIRAIQVGAATVVLTGVSWAITNAVMSGLGVGPQPGLHTTQLAAGAQIGHNFKWWWQSIAVLGNGDFFGRGLTFTSGLAVACGLLSIGAVVLLPRLGWRELRAGMAERSTSAHSAPTSARVALAVFWCSSAIFLSVAFLLSAQPQDIAADRYLVGLIYAAAAVIPLVAADGSIAAVAALVGTCVFALGGVVSMAEGKNTQIKRGFPSATTADRITRIAAGQGLTYGYAGYWDAAPITWQSHLRVLVYPVSTCGARVHLCPFDLHVISSWYTPRPGIRSFLLTDDQGAALVPAPTPDLGRPVAVYHVGTITMYVYPYDLATKIGPP